MKIEKLNDDKIRITFNCEDLQKNNIDIHSFMSNSIESQSLFLNILDEAEREVGFITDDYKLSIEALALSNGTFIITVTRIEKELKKTHRVHAQRKDFSNTTSGRLVYKFCTYDDLISLENFLANSDANLFDSFTNSYLLYEYNDFIFLILENLNNTTSSQLSGILSEFAIQIVDSGLVVERIREFGLHKRR